MRRMRLVVVSVVVLAGLALVAERSMVVVDETEFVVVTSFGRPVAAYGDDPSEAGLHARWPWQTDQRIDKRLRVSDPPAREVITGDKKNLEVASYIVWRPCDPLRFLEAAGTLAAAEARLEERVAAALSSAIGGRRLDQLASTDPALWQLDALTSEIHEAVAGPAREELGVEVIDVRLRRFNHPVEVRAAVFDLIRSERQQVAAALRAEGEAQFTTLTSLAERERDAILAQADAEAERIRGAAEAEAARLLNAAQARDPAFAAFLRTLETYSALLDENATVILSASSPLLRLLTRGPSEELLQDAPPPRSAPPTAPNPVAGVPAAVPAERSTP